MLQLQLRIIAVKEPSSGMILALGFSKSQLQEVLGSITICYSFASLLAAARLDAFSRRELCVHAKHPSSTIEICFPKVPRVSPKKKHLCTSMQDMYYVPCEAEQKKNFRNGELNPGLLGTSHYLKNA
ncbi:uncharacterized protein SEPMUDRAFT_110242 [Sphaerulina musiva SO2202]|uniref:Uncharacterized protein n=1 Tax=Sphaerulina musiva (strain SO2202) TaxID=692275 RepID=M3CZY0_SPHMS|nr:uncharacterized protein SEPMUDRAFT_110242 [Sphaerulina musiva SO2202]EMF09798.1 hypothetical protein SEPMUDRAFT_110242 [Sphaerulina musiva SO2202]